MTQPITPSVQRAYLAAKLPDFLAQPVSACLGTLTEQNSRFFSSQEANATYAWEAQIRVLQSQLAAVQHLCQKIYFEFTIPRVGRRVDVLLVLARHLVLLEFKVGETHFTQHARDQVWDYALDLHHFHETSRSHCITPVVVATHAPAQCLEIPVTTDGVRAPMQINAEQIADLVSALEAATDAFCQPIDVDIWEQGSYQPSPSILEAALALYQGHQVADISRKDASGKALEQTTQTLRDIIAQARQKQRKAICFVTGVPGAGKTLVGLNLVNTNSTDLATEDCIYLSGNGPLVSILQAAFAKDLKQRKGIPLKDSKSRVERFIQNVHQFRDECLRDSKPPPEHVAIFDEAQRAWNQEQTSKFMQKKRGAQGFAQSEPAFLIACLDRHSDWAVVVCLVGGGQEINTGEAGIVEWLRAIAQHHRDWDVFLTPQLHAPEYGAQALDATLQALPSEIHFHKHLHLHASMRSFRASHVSDWVHALLARDVDLAQQHLRSFKQRFPVLLTRDLSLAKNWLKTRARGSERYGLLASSQALRLKPLGIHVKAPIDPVHWFLQGKDDVRSSFALEDVATEFHVQGLELDWACVLWDADLRMTAQGWSQHSFKGARWTRINQPEDQRYLLNAYRVLLTRARQGMVIVVPEGCDQDMTRPCSFYDPTYDYLKSLGLALLT